MSENTLSTPSRLRTALAWPRVWGLAAALWALIGVWLLLPKPPALVEAFYTRGLYRLNVAVATAFTSWAPFSIALIVVALILLGLPALWLATWAMKRRRGAITHWQGFMLGAAGFFALVPAILLWFLFSWAVNYGRVPAEERLHFDTAAIKDDENTALRAQMFDLVMRDLPTPEQRDPQRAIAAISEAMRGVVRMWDGVGVTIPSRVKATPKGLLLANGTSGMAVPLTLEPHVDGGLPPTAFVQTAAHELGHVTGLAVEAEATLMGFVAGLRAKDTYARYCVALDVYMDLAAQLPPAEYKAAFEKLPPMAKEDIKAAREAGKKYRFDLYQQVSWRAYDRYLKAQGIKEGKKNYGRGVTLFVYAWRKGLVEIAAPS